MTGESAALLEKARLGDNGACEDLLTENAGLIWSIVRRYYGRGVDSDDLYQLGCLGFLKAVRGFDHQLGCLGFLKAVRGFDPDYGCQFSTYAVPKIAGEIRRFLRDDGPVKVSRTVKESAMALRAARDKLTYRLGREPTLSELSVETGMEPEEIAAADTATASVASLQSETGEEGLTLEGVLADGADMAEEVAERVTLRAAIEALPDRERQVVVLRYYRNFTQDQTARVLSVSQVQVSRIEKKAMEKLRGLLASSV